MNEFDFIAALRGLATHPAARGLRTAEQRIDPVGGEPCQLPLFHADHLFDRRFGPGNTRIQDDQGAQNGPEHDFPLSHIAAKTWLL